MHEINNVDIVSPATEEERVEKEVRTPSDFSQTVRTLVHSLGGSFSYDHKICLGAEGIEGDDGRFREIDIIVGEIRSQEILYDTDYVFDENNGEMLAKQRYVYCDEYRFGRELQAHFDYLLAALPTTTYARILHYGSELVVRIYKYFEPAECSNFLEQTVPLSDDLIGFTQGEWVLVTGDDTHHRIASFGKNDDGCRYWIVYDPVNKSVAASHLDLSTDVEAVQEMVSALVQNGSEQSNLQIHGSQNTPEHAMRKIKRLFQNVTYDLNEPELVFDAATGEFGIPDEEMRATLASDNVATNRLTRDLELRLRYQIGHVLRYRSPGL